MVKRVFLKYRFRGWYFHSLYSEIIDHPPQGFRVEYEKLGPQNKTFHLLDSKAAHPLIKEILFHLKPIPYIIAQRLSKYDPTDYDLVYAAQHVLFNSHVPWVTDFEFANALAAYGNISLVKNVIQKSLEHSQCKFLLPWSEWSKETLLRSLDCVKLKEKIRVIHYTVRPKNFSKQKHDGLNILFVGSANPMNSRNIQFKNLKEIILPKT